MSVGACVSELGECECVYIYIECMFTVSVCYSSYLYVDMCSIT